VREFEGLEHRVDSTKRLISEIEDADGRVDERAKGAQKQRNACAQMLRARSWL